MGVARGLHKEIRGTRMLPRITSTLRRYVVDLSDLKKSGLDIEFPYRKKQYDNYIGGKWVPPLVLLC